MTDTTIELAEDGLIEITQQGALVDLRSVRGADARGRGRDRAVIGLYSCKTDRTSENTRSHIER
jgi:hypothetical protein